MVSDGGIPPKLTGWLPMALWDPQSLCSCPSSLLLCASSYCKGFDSGTPRAHHREANLWECLPSGPALFPHFWQGFSFSILLKQMASLGCHAHTGKQCVFCQIHLKRQTLGFPERAARHLLWSTSLGQLWHIWAWRHWSYVCSASFIFITTKGVFTIPLAPGERSSFWQ